MSNFTFLPAEFKDLAAAATRAEGHIMGDPRAACFHARFALEAAVHWLYRHDAGLRMSYDQSLGALLHEPCFQNLLPEAVFQEVVNLVFFKPVYSRIKFWQMIGRGTRLCPDLFGPGDDKPDFRVFDFCFNFDFFRENPEGIEANGSAPLGTRLFRARVQLLGHLQTAPELDPDAALKGALTDGLHGEVAAMHRDNFIVRMHLEAVERFQQRGAWEDLNEADREAPPPCTRLPSATCTPVDPRRCLPGRRM